MLLLLLTAHLPACLLDAAVAVQQRVTARRREIVRFEPAE